MTRSRLPVSLLPAAQLARWLPYAAVAVLAFAVRLSPVLHGGGLGSFGRYDDGVYYAAADSLTFGRVPYREFVLLHPPAIMLVLAPFALLGRITSDATGMAVARLAFMAIGALNTVLVARLARRWGLVAMVLAATLYAVWQPAVYGEESTLLEPLGSTALLVALLLLLRTERAPSRRGELVAGAVLGAAVTLKIWYVAPWLTICAWQLVERRPRVAARLLAAGAAAAAVIVVPFAILSGTRMYDMTVRDQLLRPVGSAPRLGRLSSIFGIRGFVAGHSTIGLVTALVMVVVGITALACLTDRTARLLVAVLACNLLVLIGSPSYFGHYAHLVAAPAALVFGVGLARLAHYARWQHAPALVTGLALLGCAYSAARVATTPQGHPVSGALLASAAPPGCIAADSDELLIQMNKLSADLRAHCRVLVDVSGITYDSLHRVGPDGRSLPRRRNRAWLTYLYNYLVSARAFVVIRAPAELSPRVYHQLVAHRPLARSDGVVLRAGIP
jgi:alpha-1,2-mannosyltransferase